MQQQPTRATPPTRRPAAAQPQRVQLCLVVEAFAHNRRRRFAPRAPCTPDANQFSRFAEVRHAIPMLSLAVSAMVVLLMSGMILWQTSDIIHGGETNYIMATVTLYITIFNLFVSLLQILGIFSGDD